MPVETRRHWHVRARPGPATERPQSSLLYALPVNLSLRWRVSAPLSLQRPLTRRGQNTGPFHSVRIIDGAHADAPGATADRDAFRSSDASELADDQAGNGAWHEPRPW